MNKWLLFVLAAFCLSGVRHPDAVFRRLANIVGPTDDRGMIKEIGTQIGLSQSEVEQIRSSVGYVACPGKPGVSAASVTGFLVAPDLVVSVAHVFYTVDGNRREPWDECYYQSMGDHIARYPIVKGSIRIGSDRPHQNRTQDFAVFKLAKPVYGARPFLLPAAGSSLDEDAEIYPISAYREAKYVTNESPHEPLGQICRARKILPAVGSGLSAFYSDCDNTFGGSGGPNVVRTPRGLTVVGLFVGAADPAHNFKPYYDKWATPADANQFSVAVSIFVEGRLVEIIQSKLARKSSAKPSKRTDHESGRSFLNLD